MITGLGHIGIAVKDIDESVRAFSKTFGIPPAEIKDNRDRKIRFCVIDLYGTIIELIQDYSGKGEFARFARKNGTCIHHFCLLSDDIEKDVRTMEMWGVEMADKIPKTGLRGKNIAFSKKSALNGIPFELSEP
jgi:methylmalonyl-CoA/ethylmalonyl-CoA epimerase